MKYDNLKNLNTGFYANDGISFLNLRFENDVKLYGIQAAITFIASYSAFENDVKLYGIQAKAGGLMSSDWFENDVKLYGIQASIF